MNNTPSGFRTTIAATLPRLRLQLDASFLDITQEILEERLRFVIESSKRLGAEDSSELITMDDENASLSYIDQKNKGRPLFMYVALSLPIRFRPGALQILTPRHRSPVEFVSIAVSTGAKKEEFMVHKNLICFHSLFSMLPLRVTSKRAKLKPWL
jgi:hypothetical protein